MTTALACDFDPKAVARIQALNSYASSQDFVSESWGTSHFKRTFDAAYELCKDGVSSTMGFEFTWYPSRAYIFCASSSTFSGTLQFHRELPLTGVIAEAFIADLTARALTRAIRDIKHEDEEALKLRAQARLTAMLSAVDCVRSPT